MGAILEAAEYLKEPLGMGIFVVFIVGMYFFVKWVMADDEEQK